MPRSCIPEPSIDKDLRPKLPMVADAVESKMERYVVTRRGQPVMMLINLGHRRDIYKI